MESVNLQFVITKQRNKSAIFLMNFRVPVTFDANRLLNPYRDLV